MQMLPYPQKEKREKCYPEFKAGKHLEFTGENNALMTVAVLLAAAEIHHVKKLRFHLKSLSILRKHITSSSFHLDKNCDAEIGLKVQEQRQRNGP